MIEDTDTELKPKKMEFRIMDSGKMDKKRDMVTLSFLTIMSMMGNGKMTKLTV
jgi:hypothetical protein